MIKVSIHFGLFFLILLIGSCSKENTSDCVKSTGDVVKEDRLFNSFNNLIVQDNINIILVQDLPGKVLIEAGENLLSKITVTPLGNALLIKNENKCNWVRRYDVPINVYVGVNQVKLIDLFGYGSISNGETIETDTLRINILNYGSADISIKSTYVGFLVDNKGSFTLKGTVNRLAGTSYSNAFVDIKGTNVKWVYMNSKSLLDTQVYCDSLIQATIRGDGNIVCFGNPPLIDYRNEGGEGILEFFP